MMTKLQGAPACHNDAARHLPSSETPYYAAVLLLSEAMTCHADLHACFFGRGPVISSFSICAE